MCLKENTNYRLRMNDQVFESWGMHFQPPRWHTNCAGSMTDTNNEWIEYIESFDFFEAMRRIEKGEKVKYQGDWNDIFFKRDSVMLYSLNGVTGPAGYLNTAARFLSVP